MKIIELLDNPDMRKLIGVFGRQRVVRELVSVYEAPKLLAAHGELFSNI